MSDVRKETGIPQRTQLTWLKASVRRPGAECSGRSIKLNQDTVKKMVKHMEEHYDRRHWFDEVHFHQNLHILSESYEIMKKETVRIAYRNVDVLQKLNSVYEL